MFGFSACKHDFKTIAIDRTFSWKCIDRFNNNKTDQGYHLIRYVECKHCEKRDIECDDVAFETRQFAMSKSEEINAARVQWVHAAEIRNTKKVIWVDESRAPLRGFENWVAALKHDPEMKELLDHKTVDDALGALEIAVKLCINNNPMGKTDDKDVS